MINALNGQVVQADAASLVLNVSGVEFALEVSSRCAAHFASFIGKGFVRVLTVFQVREDSMTLFGFIDKAERECFTELVKVPGIAGKGALKILSAISVNDFILKAVAIAVSEQERFRMRIMFGSMCAVLFVFLNRRFALATSPSFKASSTSCVSM